MSKDETASPMATVLGSGAVLIIMGLMLSLTAGNGRCHCTRIFLVGIPMLALGFGLLAFGVRRRRSQPR